jgi:hypothetical protein
MTILFELFIRMMTSFHHSLLAWGKLSFDQILENLLSAHSKFWHLFSSKGLLKLQDTIGDTLSLAKVNLTENSSEWANQPFAAVLIILAACLFILLLLRFFTKISFSNVESYTTTKLLLNKVRILSTLSLVLFPAFAYIETEVLGLYEVDWVILIILIIGTSVGFVLSFIPGLTHFQARLIPAITFPFVYGLLAFALYEQNIPITLGVEVGIIVLFSKLVFTNFRWTIYFLSFAVILNIALYFFWLPDAGLNLVLYLSVSIQALIIVVGLWLAEGSNLDQLSFARKVLESADIFVLVRDLDGTIVFVNDYTCKESNVPEHE